MNVHVDSLPEDEVAVDYAEAVNPGRSLLNGEGVEVIDPHARAQRDYHNDPSDRKALRHIRHCQPCQLELKITIN
jgi:hypothetical protein